MKLNYTQDEFNIHTVSAESEIEAAALAFIANQFYAISSKPIFTMDADLNDVPTPYQYWCRCYADGLRIIREISYGLANECVCEGVIKLDVEVYARQSSAPFMFEFECKNVSEQLDEKTMLFIHGKILAAKVSS